jgi:hypothetical protein
MNGAEGERDESAAMGSDTRWWFTLGCVLLLSSLCAQVHARTPLGVPIEETDAKHAMAEQAFLKEYAMGVHRIPMDGGKIYGWKLNDRVTFGRFKGENDKFGFSVEMNPRDRIEITTEGVRLRRSLGGAHH